MICSMYIVHINCAMYNAQFFNTLNCFALLVVAREYNFEAVSRHKLLCAMVECKGIQCWSTTQATLSKQLTGTSYSAHWLNTREYTAQATLSKHWHKLLCWMAGAPSQVSGLFARAPFISKLQTSTILKAQLQTIDLPIANLETTFEHCRSSHSC